MQLNSVSSYYRWFMLFKFNVTDREREQEQRLFLANKIKK